MKLILESGRSLHGEAAIPGDKSISHRAALFSALAQGESRVDHFLVSGVTDAMLKALTALGIRWSLDGTTLTVSGRGLRGLQTPAAPLDCGNSATTIRMLAGALAAGGTAAVLDGSPGLRRRPMSRVVIPLQSMGVPIDSSPGGCAPLHLVGRPSDRLLRPLRYLLPVSSAQVKTCLLLAALAADGPTTLGEQALSRDHSERMLRGMGVTVETTHLDNNPAVILTPPREGRLEPLNLSIPGDFSSAAFLLVAGLIVPGSRIVLKEVNLNPTRTGLLETLTEMGADITVSDLTDRSGEPVGDLTVCASQLHGVSVSGARVVGMIDEFPIFAVAAAYARGETDVSNAEELRYKESDRISALCQELHAQGADVNEKSDGFTINGVGRLTGGALTDPHGDHRLAMAMAVAGLAADQPVGIANPEIISESFPNFVDVLQALGANSISES